MIYLISLLILLFAYIFIYNIFYTYNLEGLEQNKYNNKEINELNEIKQIIDSNTDVIDNYYKSLEMKSDILLEGEKPQDVIKVNKPKKNKKETIF